MRALRAAARDFIRTLRQRKLVRSLAVLAGGATLGQAISVLAAPVISRLYTPEDFGVLAVYTSILSLISVIVALRYEVAIPLPEDDTGGYDLLTLSLTISLIFALSAALLLPLSGDFLVTQLNAPGLRPYLWMLPLGIIGTGAYLPFNYWALRKKRYDRIAATRLNQALSNVGVQIVGGLLKLGPLGLIFGQIMGQTAGIGTLSSLVWHKSTEKQIKPRYSLSGMRTVLRRYRRFPLISSWAAFLNVLGLQLPTLVLSSWYGSQVTGWFSFSQRFVGLPLALVGGALAQFYLSEAAEVNRSTVSTGLLTHLLWRTVAVAALISAPFLLFTMLGPWIFPAIFGASWSEAGLYARPLGLMYVANFLASPTGSTLDILERQDLHLLREFVRVILMGGALALAKYWQASPLTVIVLISVSGIFSYLSYILISLYAIRARQAQGTLRVPPAPVEVDYDREI